MNTGIATLMLLVDGDHPNDAEIQKVGAFAAELGARLIGVSVSDHPPSFYFAAGAAAIDVLQEDEERMKQRMAGAGQRCHKVLASQRQPFEWRSAVGIPIDVVARESRAADLLVCFARREAATYSDTDAGELVLKAGRPLLVVPEAATWRAPDRILITWKESRETRRAVHDALPFLRRARRINIVEVVEGEESLTSAEARLHDVVVWLKAHSVEATPQIITQTRDVVGAIAKSAKDFNADWIVAGAYGHSRVGEWFFGGVTRHLLTESDRLAFLSH